MFKGDRNFAVGLFVSIAIAVFVAFVIWLTGRTGVEEMTRYTLLFDRDVSGLAVGGPVKYMGMTVGSVVHMDIYTDNGNRVRVDIEVLETTPVDKRTYASLALQGITGVAVVNLASETDQDTSESGQDDPQDKLLPGEYPRIPVRDVGFAAIISSAPEIMNKLDITLTHAGELLGEANQARIGNTLKNVEDLTTSLASSRESLAGLPQDLSATLGEIQATVGKLQAVIAELRPDLSSTMANLERSSANLESLTARFDRMMVQHEDDMGRFLEEGLGEAPELMRETRQTLRHLEKLAAELRDDPSQLVHRPAAESLEIDP
jgi:phospholipid/cholesterol/gamma-HCH transport system substrate-binding protein